MRATCDTNLNFGVFTVNGRIAREMTVNEYNMLCISKTNKNIVCDTSVNFGAFVSSDIDLIRVMTASEYTTLCTEIETNGFGHSVKGMTTDQFCVLFGEVNKGE